jgi:protein-disulfide isomerase
MSRIMTKSFLYAGVAAMAAMLPLCAQVAPQQEGITRQQADQILDELRQIRLLLEKQAGGSAKAPAKPPEVHAKMDLAGVQMLGSKNAPITIVEFTDYQCPFCQRFHKTVFSDLKKNYIDTGKVRFYSRDMPLDFHANAMRAAQGARCAAEQNQFWKLRDIMAANPDKLEMADLERYATDLKMDVKAFRSCVESEKYRGAVQSDVLEAMNLGAEGTPSFIVGKSTSDGVDGVLVVGAQPYAVFQQKLQALEQK